MAYRVHAFMFPLWTFAIIAGAIWAENAWGRYWGWDPKETWAFITWVVYAAYLHARATAGWKGRRAAIIALVGVRRASCSTTSASTSSSRACTPTPGSDLTTHGVTRADLRARTYSHGVRPARRCAPWSGSCCTPSSRGRALRFIDCILIPGPLARALPKWLWLIVIVLVPFFGALAWLLAGRPPVGPTSPAPRAGVGRIVPRSGGPGAVAPDDDPTFLRKLADQTSGAARCATAVSGDHPRHRSIPAPTYRDTVNDQTRQTPSTPRTTTPGLSTRSTRRRWAADSAAKQHPSSSTPAARRDARRRRRRALPPQVRGVWLILFAFLVSGVLW